MASNAKERPEGAAYTVPPMPQIKISESEASSLVLDSYVMHIQTNLCQCCSNGERFSTLFEVWVHPTQTRLSRFNKLIPVLGVKVNSSLPIAIIELPHKPVPFCSDCPDAASLTFGQQPTTTFPSRQAWADTLQRKSQQVYVEERRAAAAKPTPTLDML